MSQGTLTVNTEKLLPIIKKWLYSEKDIFLRELVANACDALKKWKHIKHTCTETSPDSIEQIESELNEVESTITIKDGGVGMIQEELEKYIAQIAFSGAEEFLEKYSQAENPTEEIIGHFGLGFYSAYMVANKVDIDSLSFQPDAEPAFWSCSGGKEYTLSKGTRSERGTTITLHINDDGKEFLSLEVLERLLSEYCGFLPFPITINGKCINETPPLWTKQPQDVTKEEYLDFFQKLYPGQSEPLFFVHINVDFPIRLQGILYFPQITQQVDLKKNSAKLFCNRVFVANSCSVILPEFLTVLQGALDSPDLPLNVSRSALQKDKLIGQCQQHVVKKIIQKLELIHKEETEHFTSLWKKIEGILKLGVLQDDTLYEKMKHLLLWKTSKDIWMTVDEYCERNDSKTVYYTQQPHSPLLPLYEKKGIEVLLLSSYFDPPLMNFLEQKNIEWHFSCIDSATDNISDDTETEIVDSTGTSTREAIVNMLKGNLSHINMDIEGKNLPSDTLPGMIVTEEHTRRLRDILSITDNKDMLSQITNKKKLVINTHHPFVKKMMEMYTHNPTSSLHATLGQHLYETICLSQQQLPQEAIPKYIERQYEIYQALLTEPSFANASS